MKKFKDVKVGDFIYAIDKNGQVYSMLVEAVGYHIRVRKDWRNCGDVPFFPDAESSDLTAINNCSLSINGENIVKVAADREKAKKIASEIVNEKIAKLLNSIETTMVFSKNSFNWIRVSIGDEANREVVYDGTPVSIPDEESEKIDDKFKIRQ